jgi:hypothetical protein
MKKLSILLVVLATMTIIGCGQVEKAETPPIVQVEAEPVEPVECRLFSICRSYCEEKYQSCSAAGCSGWREECLSVQITPCANGGACYYLPE